MNKWWDPSSTTTLHSPQVGNWCENQSIETNSRIRSRSATTPEPAAIQQDVLPSSFSLYNLTERDHGQSLLLTKAFVYQSPSTRNKELHRRQQEQYNNSSELVNPFQSPSDDSEDDDDSDKLDSPFADDYYTTNNKPNSYMIPPPPVPTQLTKPAFLKYTRNSFPKRSQSTKETKKKKQVYQHQRHKSISSNYYFK
ncbi:hypothetical protein K501DRAFT_24418 [Backusella circina FSU 941]|nr:hypothetical protein K501DRAFT_24418 [Backusella circina FSU 941]